MSFTAEQLTAYLEQWQTSGLLPFIVIGLYLVGTVLFIPVVVLFLVSAYLLPPIQGALCSLVGIVASSLIGYSLGRLGGNKILARVPKRIISKIRSKISGHEVLSVAIIRKIPIAPFIIVNMVLGAINIPAVHFALGTALGMTPAVILVGIFDQSYESAMGDPSPRTIALVVAVTAAALALAYFAPAIGRRLRMP